MATTKDIKVKIIASSNLEQNTALDWIRNDLGFPGFNWPTDNGVSPAGLIVMYAAKRCYNAFGLEHNKNLTKVREELAPHIANILSSGHGSCLEHVTYTFAIEGVTRVLTGELNRHRVGVAISEGSGRYIRFDDIPYRLPTCFHGTKEERALVSSNGPDYDGPRDSLAYKKWETALIFNDHFEDTERRYALLEYIWREELASSDFHLKKELTSAFRRIVGIGHCTGGTWTFNIRALRHIMTLRSTEFAEEEIRELARLIYEAVVPREPLLFADLSMDANGVIS